MDKELCSLKRGISSLYGSYQQFDREHGLDSSSPGQLEGRRHTKRRYSPPLSSGEPADSSPGRPSPSHQQSVPPTSEATQDGHIRRPEDETSGGSREAQGQDPAQPSQGGGGSSAGSQAQGEVWGHPAPTLAEPNTATGVPLEWLELDHIPPPQPASPPRAPPSLPAEHRWWEELEMRCPVSVAKDANRQLMQQRDADSRRRHMMEMARRGEGSGQPQGSGEAARPTIKAKSFNPQAVAQQMELLAAGQAGDRLFLGEMGRVKRRVVDSIAFLYHLDLREVPAVQPGLQSNSGHPAKAYFTTEHTAPLTDAGRLLLEQILANHKRGPKCKQKQEKEETETQSPDEEPSEKRRRKKAERKEKSLARKEEWKQRRQMSLAAAALPLAPTWGWGQEAKDRLAAGMQQPLQEDNKGSQMLVGMGWQHGQGIGARQQGMLEPVMVTPRKRALGLGAE